MADIVTRVLWQNNVKNTASVMSASSEQSAHPVRWLKDQIRSDSYRSKPGWTDVVGINDALDFTEGSDKRVAQPPAANYPDGVSRAAAIQTALGVAGIDPSSLTPSGWWRADRIALNDGGLVASWPDQSGNGRDLTQSVDAKKPTWKRSVINGRPAVLFSGAQELSSAAALSAFIANNAGTIFVVFYEDPTSTGSREIVKDRNNKAGISADDSNVSGRNDDGAADTVTKANTEGTWHVACWQHDTSVKISLDDHDDAAQATAVSGNTNDLTGVLDVGHRNSASYMIGYVAELIAFPSSLTQENRRRVTQYLYQRYLITDATTLPTWANTYTVTYDATTKKFTVARSGGAATISLNVASGPNLIRSGWKDLGFTADKTGSTSYAGDVASYQSRHWIDLDAGGDVNATCCSVLTHNILGSATVRLYNGASPYDILNGSPTSIPGDATARVAYFGTLSGRLWRLQIDDVSNPIGFAEVGVLHVGPYTQVVTSYAPGLEYATQEYSTVSASDHGAPFQDDRPQARLYPFVFNGIDATDVATWQTIRAYAKIGRCFIVAIDPLNNQNLVVYGYCPEPIKIANINGVLYSAGMTFLEAAQ